VGLSDLFSRLRRHEPASDDTRGVSVQTMATKALPRFLTALGNRDQPVLLDLGSVVGSNVTFFGEQLGCKIFVEDLAKDIDRHVRENRTGEMAAFFSRRFPQADASFDGIIGWDAFDYLDKPAAQALAAEMVRLLRPDGVMLAFFNQTEAVVHGPAVYTRHVVVDPRTLEHRSHPAARGKQRPLNNRDIQRMFEPLRITDQFLLKTNMRELILRKPAAAGPPQDAPPSATPAS
jgi:SAM-dependent methyltransferase